MKSKAMIKQAKASLPEIVVLVAKTAANALLRLDASGQVVVAVAGWMAGKGLKGKKPRPRKRRKAAVPLNRAKTKS